MNIWTEFKNVAAVQCCWRQECHVPDRRASADHRSLDRRERPPGQRGRTAGQGARRRALAARLTGVYAAPFSQAAVIHGLRVPVSPDVARIAADFQDLADIWAARTGHEVRLVSANDHIDAMGLPTMRAGRSISTRRILTGFGGDAVPWRYRVLWNVPLKISWLHDARRTSRTAGRALLAAPAFGSGDPSDPACTGGRCDDVAGDDDQRDRHGERDEIPEAGAEPLSGGDWRGARGEAATKTIAQAASAGRTHRGTRARTRLRDGDR